MKLLSLRANHSSFHTIDFKDGINIIVGKQVTPHSENDGNTYNGVGKSLTLHLIHFCLGSRKIESLAKGIPDWEFTLTFEIDGNEYYSTRAVNDQNKIVFCGETLKPKALQDKLLELCFGLNTTPKDMTWTTLFSRFVRRYRLCYTTFDSFVLRESDYSKILNNCFLLGIDTELIVGKRELRDRQTATAATEKAIKKDPLFRQYYLGKSDAELDIADLEYRISELQKEISEFKVSNNYHELEKEADDKSYQKKILENRRFLISNYIKNIDEEILTLGQRMDELLDYLNSHGALEEYVALTKQLSSLQNELNRIHEYQKILKTYRDTRLDIRAALIEQDKATDTYLEDESNYLDELKTKFWNYAKRFYPKKKSGLVIKNNSGENMLRYSLEARIEDDSSDGVNEVRMFCFDWLLLNCRKSKMRFIAHDSRMFANMDPRQRETLFQIVYETCQTTGLQYIC